MRYEIYHAGSVDKVLALYAAPVGVDSGHLAVLSLHLRHSHVLKQLHAWRQQLLLQLILWR